MTNQNIKALSLKQPFASLIVNWTKKIELRTWNTNYRWRFRVHASLAPYTKKDYMWLKYDEKMNWVIVWLAELIDVKKYKNKEEYQADMKLHCATDPSWFHEPLYWFIIWKTIKISPVKCKWSLNFFAPSIDLDAEKFIIYGE